MQANYNKPVYMENIKIENFGPLGKVDVSFGDLTFLVGAQASGKSLFLELLKLLEDKNAIISNLKKFSFIVNRKDVSNLLNANFGNGMADVWRDDTKIEYDSEDYSDKELLLKNKVSKEEEKMFYIPAQRIFSISDGRAKPFTEFDPSAPYVLRQFSETLRIFMNTGLGGGTRLFPISTRLKAVQRKSFDDSIFHGGKIELENENGQRKMRLKIDGMDMPFMTWSAGQKEFMPLLMGFYCVSGPPMHVLNKDQYKYVVIEEPEMGLHPQAIMSVLLQILELVQSGKKVIVSTHSTVPLEFVWAFNMLKKSHRRNKAKALMTLFDKSVKDAGILADIFKKEIKTYSFARKENGVESVDISTLDAFDNNKEIRDWGGLSEFASSTGELVSRYCND